MSLLARASRRLTQAAVGRHLSRRTVRIRLTLLYGALFLASGAALLAVTFVLVDNDTGVVLTSGTSTAQFSGGNLISLSHPVPAKYRKLNRLPRFNPAQARAQWLATQRQLGGDAESEHRQILERLAIESGIALAVMSLLSLGLGWVMAGRVLQPLEASYEAQRQFVANASHELRTPLARQRALIQVALADPGADFASLRNAHERVLASEQRLAEMIDALLTLTRGQAGPERREPLDLQALVDDALLARGPELAEFELRTSLRSAPLTGDPRLIDRLLSNLLDNALRHNVAGGFVEISSGLRDRRAFLLIVNSGPVVAADQVERLFQPFQRLSGNRTTLNSGHGLGLSIVQAIADTHRALLTTLARPEGGLSIEVSFPPAAAAAELGRRRSAGRLASALAPRRIS